MVSTTKCERAFLLLVFILGFATIAEPLYKKWRNKVPFWWQLERNVFGQGVDKENETKIAEEG